MNRMLNPRNREELAHIGKSLLMLAVSVGTVWFVVHVLEVEGNAVLITLLFIPLVFYLAVSGRIREVAAGDLSLKLTEAGREPIGHAASTAQPVAVDVGPRIDASEVSLKTDPNRSHVVTLIQGREAQASRDTSGNLDARRPYSREEVLDRLTDLAAGSPVPLLVVLDHHERVLAYMTYRSALDVLQREERGEHFIALVNSGDPDAFDGGGGFSAVKTETLPQTATNVDALSAMESTGLDTLVVVDKKGRFAGIVERGRVISRMLLTLVSEFSRQDEPTLDDT